MPVTGSGARDRLVTVQSMSASKGSSNYPVETWVDLADVWASKRDLRGMERFTAAQMSAPYETRWELPYSANWDPELVDVPKSRRLVVDGRVHNIVAAEEVQRRRLVAVMTVAGGRLQ